MSDWQEFERYLIETRYSERDEEGNPIEHTYDQVLDRICEYIEYVFEKTRVSNLGSSISQCIISALQNREFIPATPFLMNAGNRKTKHKGFFSCYPLGPIPDSTKGIMEAALRMVNIYQAAGGVGIDISRLRPKSSPVDNAQGISSGPVTFLNLYDAVAGTISQGGKRRGALMVQMNWNHKDILEFVTCKKNNNKLTNMNVSVNVFGDFFTHSELVQEIAECMWSCGDPGLLFIENMKKYSPLTSDEAVYVNPCGEYVSEKNTACNLLTVNLTNLNFEKDIFSQVLERGYLACLLGNIILDLDGYPDETIKQKTLELRPVGIGVTGYHKLINQLGMTYSESGEFAKKLQCYLMLGTMHASEVLARFLKEYVPWDELYTDELLESAKLYCDSPILKDVEKCFKDLGGYYNCLTTVQAPTGSVSQLLHVLSTGIEPYFATKITRRVKDLNGGWLSFTLEDKDMKTETVSPKSQIEILSSIQKFVHASVSKTINLPESYSVEEIKNLIFFAKEKKLKGLTVFREKSKQGVLEKASEGGTRAKRSGVTYKFRGNSTVYITANKVNKKLFELFVTCSKPGRELCSLTEGLGRAISIGLQHGTPPEEYAKTLSGIQGELILTNPEFKKPVQSICDAVSKVISVESSNHEEIEKQNRDSSLGICPECEQMSLKRNGGCLRCELCGYTSC